MNPQLNIEDLMEECSVGGDAPMPEGIPDVCEFTGKKVVFSGFTVCEKATLGEVAAKCGMVVQTTVGKSTEFLICGATAGTSKLQRAAEQGVEILTAEQMFRRMGVDFIPAWVYCQFKTPEDAERTICTRILQRLPLETLRRLLKTMAEGTNA